MLPLKSPISNNPFIKPKVYYKKKGYCFMAYNPMGDHNTMYILKFHSIAPWLLHQFQIFFDCTILHRVLINVTPLLLFRSSKILHYHFLKLAWLKSKLGNLSEEADLCTLDYSRDHFLPPKPIYLRAARWMHLKTERFISKKKLFYHQGKNKFSCWTSLFTQQSKWEFMKWTGL